MSWFDKYVQAVGKGVGAAGHAVTGLRDFAHDNQVGVVQQLGNLMGNDTPGGSAPQAVPSAAKAAVQVWMSTLPPDRQALVQAWLNGGELSDPDLARGILTATVGQAVPGAGTFTGPAAAVVPANAVANPADGPGAGGANPGAVPGAGGANPPVANSVAPAAAAPALPQPSATPWATTEGGDVLLEDAPSRQRFVDRQVGLNPDLGGMAAKFFDQSTGPSMSALAALYNFLPGQGDTFNRGQVGTNLANYGQSFITQGQDGYRNARDYATQIAANPDFISKLMDVGADDTSDGPGQLSNLQDLMTLRNAGARGLGANWLNQQYNKLVNAYRDSNMGLVANSAYGGAGDKFTTFLQQHPEYQGIAQQLFGWTPPKQ